MDDDPANAARIDQGSYDFVEQGIKVFAPSSAYRESARILKKFLCAFNGSILSCRRVLFYAFPRWIPENAIEAALVEDLWEGDVPVEEAVLFCELVDFGFEVCGERFALDEVAEGARRYSDGSAE